MKCYVCNKEGCRSWKYIKEERENTRDKILPKYQQYLVDDESDDPDPPEESSTKSNDTNDFEPGVFLIEVAGNINSQDILKELSY